MMEFEALIWHCVYLVCRDAKALQEKAAKKAAQAAGGNNAGGGRGKK